MKKLVILFSAAALLTAGILSQPVTAEVSGLNNVGNKREFPRAYRSYDQLNPTFARIGRPKSVTAMRRVQIGSSKRQLVAVVGQPVSAFSDGSWNFNVALPLPQRNELVCQYRVYFDDQDRVSGTLWRRPQCADIVTGREK